MKELKERMKKICEKSKELNKRIKDESNLQNVKLFYIVLYIDPKKLLISYIIEEKKKRKFNQKK